MVELNLAPFIQLLLLTSVIPNLVSCALYKEYGLEDERICHPLVRKRKLKLTDTRNSAVIVRPYHLFDRWFVTVDKNCKFVIEANKEEGLFAVIQTISFRRNGTECIDYVEFKREDGYKTERFCGQMDRTKIGNYPVPEPNGNFEAVDPLRATGTYAEFDIKGELETRIFISKERLLPNETLNLIIVYTPYRDCDKVNSEEYKSTGLNACISKDYFCDGYQNCATDTCLDEANCSFISANIVGNGTGTKVTIGAVTTIFLSFIIFLTCLWICRRHKKMCWSSDCAGPSVDTARTVQSVPEAEDPLGRPVPTAPMLEVVVPAPVHDKDLPPSYDSLFPEQTNPTTT